MDLKVIGRESVDWMHVGQRRDKWRVLVNRVMNLSVELIIPIRLCSIVYFGYKNVGPTA